MRTQVFRGYCILFLIGVFFLFPGCEKLDFPGISKATGHSRKFNFKIEKVYTPATRHIDTFFEGAYKKGQFNGVALFADRGKIVYEKAFGYANFDKKELLTETSVFQLASVSKQFTAFAIMLLKERGQLSYEDTLGHFFRGFPYGRITIRQLLNHSSGLPNYMYFAEQYWPNKRIPLRNSDLIWMMNTYRPDKYFNPGQRYFYSNTGYGLLASIVERVSKTSFPVFMKREVFEPLGMKHTFVLDSKSLPSGEGIAWGHRPNRRLEAYNYQNGVVGDKGVYSTVEDMLRWDQSLYQSNLIERKSLDEAFMPAFETLRTHNYGFGWRIMSDENLGKIVYHGGWWKGYRTYFVRAVDKHKTVIVLMNMANHPPFRIKDLLNMF